MVSFFAGIPAYQSHRLLLPFFPLPTCFLIPASTMSFLGSFISSYEDLCVFSFFHNTVHTYLPNIFQCNFSFDVSSICLLLIHSFGAICSCTTYCSICSICIHLTFCPFRSCPSVPSCPLCSAFFVSFIWPIPHRPRLSNPSGTCDTFCDHFRMAWLLCLLSSRTCLFMLLRFSSTYPTTGTSFGRLRGSILLFYWSSSVIPLKELVPT